MTPSANSAIMYEPLTLYQGHKNKAVKNNQIKPAIVEVLLVCIGGQVHFETECCAQQPCWFIAWRGAAVFQGTQPLCNNLSVSPWIQKIMVLTKNTSAIPRRLVCFGAGAV